MIWSSSTSRSLIPPMFCVLQPDSIYFLRQPHDFVAFIHQVSQNKTGAGGSTKLMIQYNLILINIIAANFRSSVFWRQIIYITSSHRSGDQANTKSRPLSFTPGAASMRATVQRCPTLRRSCWRRLVARIRKLKQKNNSDHISDHPPLMEKFPHFPAFF